jgi:uncharacterized protein involved in type VI secretion and phage assembly
MGRFYGKYRGVVIDNLDPELRGRVRASVPVVLGEISSAWALPCLPFAGNNVGFYAVPPVGAEVWIEFEDGDPDRPILAGSLWPDASVAPPEALEPPLEGRLLVKTGGGSLMISGEASKMGGIILQTAGGQSVLLRDGPGFIEIQDSHGNRLRMESSGITLNSPAKVTVNASNVEVSAGMVTVEAGLSRFSGVVQADTVICNSVISQSYTPGAGNIW